MKLGSTMVERTLDQFEAQAVPENHPAVPQLNQLFGDHTFFLDANGLNIVEPADPGQASAHTWRVVKLAGWKDATQTSLMPHNPEPTDIVFTLPSDGPAEEA